MVPELRKRHRLIWQLGSLFLVAGFIGAVWVLPQPPAPGQWVQNEVKSYGRIMAEKYNEHYTYRLNVKDAAHLQIEVIRDQGYPVPLIELLCNGTVLGVLNAQKEQCFNLKDTLTAQTTFILEMLDPIHHRTLQKLKLQ